MIGKNLKYWRMKRGMTRKALAESVGISAMSVTNYESGARTPDLQITRKLAAALSVKISDILASQSSQHEYVHAEFRRNPRLGRNTQEFVYESVEDYFNRFFCVVDALGSFVLPQPPACHSIIATGDIEADAQALRAHLGFSATGPVINLIGAMENKGIPVFLADIDSDYFSGMNGFVDGRPYIVLNNHMRGERQRSTLVHELAHLMFCFPNDDEKKTENHATAISGAFLLPKEDAIRELGIQRTCITQDMTMVAAEYGISMLMLCKRAQLLKIISDDLYKDFSAKALQLGWSKNEPSRIVEEKSFLFEQLVIRAVGEEEITLSKGAELLRIPHAEMRRMMSPEQEA